MSQQAQSADLSYTRHVHLNYLLYLPRDYDAAKRWPLILFLHGSGERGTDPDLVRLFGLPRKLETWDDCPCIVVSPQCPADVRWVFLLDTLDVLLDDILARYPVDERRVYLTGMSMGGEGAWSLAAYRPERFAALVPICGRTSPAMASRIATLPIWVFHGAKDNTVPFSASQQMVDSLHAFGSEPRFTIYPDADHDSWTQAYNEPELFPWLLEQQKKD